MSSSVAALDMTQNPGQKVRPRPNQKQKQLCQSTCGQKTKGEVIQHAHAPGPAGGVLLSGSPNRSSMVQWNNAASLGSLAALGIDSPESQRLTAAKSTPISRATSVLDKPAVSLNSLIFTIFPLLKHLFLILSRLHDRIVLI